MFHCMNVCPYMHTSIHSYKGLRTQFQSKEVHGRLGHNEGQQHLQRRLLKPQSKNFSTKLQQLTKKFFINSFWSLPNKNQKREKKHTRLREAKRAYTPIRIERIRTISTSCNLVGIFKNEIGMSTNTIKKDITVNLGKCPSSSHGHVNFITSQQSSTKL